MNGRGSRALLWLLLDTGGAQLLSFVFFLVVARLLAPAEYGVFALAAAVIGVLFYLLEGFAFAILQREHIGAEHQSAAFWGNLLIGLALTGALLLTADSIASIFGNAELAPVLRWMSLTCVLIAAVSTPLAILKRRLDVAVFAARTWLGYLVGGAVSVYLVLRGWGAVALAIGQVAQWSTVVAVVFLGFRWRPRLAFSLRACMDLAPYSIKAVSAWTIQIATWRMQIFVVGLFLDPTSIGYFALAMRLVETITAVVIAPAAGLAVSLLSPLRRARARFNETYVSLVVGAASAWLPLVIGLGFIGSVPVRIAFGDHWAGSVVVIQALCFASILEPFNAFTGHTLSAKGRPGIYTCLAVLRLSVTAVAFGIAAQLGVIAVCWAVLIVACSFLPVNLLVLRKVADVDVGRLLVNGARLLGCAIAMAAVMFALQELGNGIHPLVLAAIQTVGGALTYLVLLDRLVWPGYVRGVVRRIRTPARMLSDRAT